MDSMKPPSIDNLLKPIMEVAHHSLDPIDPEPNKLASKCPVCKKGTLGCIRDRETLILCQYDCCSLCGQRVIYTDIEKLRSGDWARYGQGAQGTETEEGHDGPPD